MRMKIPVLIAAMAALVQSGFAQQPAAPPVSRTPAVRSPEVHPDRRVTFRIYAPRATEVTVSGEFEVGAPAHKLTRDAQGVWSVTVGPFEPEIYEYDFIVDGVQMLDPRNPVVKYNRGPAAISSLLDIPGNSPRAFDVRPVAHGKVEMRYCESKTTKQTRRVHVYTPPNYERTNSRLPVLYLLHGGDGEDSVWTSFGRAHVILDNLIADKTVPPMIVVMPNGYAYGWDSGVDGRQTAGGLPERSRRRPHPVRAGQLSRVERSEGSRAGRPFTRWRPDAQHRSAPPESLQPPRRVQCRQQQSAGSVQGHCGQREEGGRAARPAVDRVRRRRLRVAWREPPCRVPQRQWHRTHVPQDRRRAHVDRVASISEGACAGAVGYQAPR